MGWQQGLEKEGGWVIDGNQRSSHVWITESGKEGKEYSFCYLLRNCKEINSYLLQLNKNRLVKEWTNKDAERENLYSYVYCIWGFEETVTLLLNAGSDLHSKNVYDETALDCAIKSIIQSFKKYNKEFQSGTIGCH